jgi:hypothetical protein
MTDYAELNKANFNLNKLARYLVVVFVSFIIVKLTLLDRMSVPYIRYLSYFIIVICLVKFNDLSYKFWSKSSKIVSKVIVILFAVYFLLSAPQVLETDTFTIRFELDYWRWFAIVCAGLSLYRPIFLLVSFMYMAQMKGAESELLQLTLSKTDYLPLLEAVTFIFIGSVIYQYFTKKGEITKCQVSESLTIFDVLFLTTLAAHFSNYFYSAVKKVWIADGSLFWWAANNQTENLILTAYQSGHFPWPIPSEYIQLLYSHMSEWSWLSNSILIAAQFIAVIAILKLNWSKLITAFYDITHIAIFALTGIFFYKWIIYNFTIIWALSYVKNITFSPLLRIYLVCIVIFAPLVFFVAKLGWFDNRSFNHEYFEAVYENGDKQEIPSNYFLGSSLTYAQQRIIRNKENGHFPTGTFGVTFGMDNVNKGNSCEYKINPNGDLFSQIGEAEVKKISARIARIHQFYIENERRLSGGLNYDLYPHHIFSFPWKFSEFKHRKKETIKYYNYVVESYCLGIEGKVDNNKLYRREVHPVYAPF